jgi:prefoldin subunit 5
MSDLVPSLESSIEYFFDEDVEQMLECIADETDTPEEAAQVAQQMAQRLLDMIATTDWAAQKVAVQEHRARFRSAFDDQPGGN